MNKTVWRLNTGKGVPDDLGSKFFMHEIINKTSELYEAFDELWSIESQGLYNIIAYQTNRTKPAKYFSLVCEECMGYGCDIDLSDEGWPPIDGTTCHSCGGIKKHLSKIEEKS